MGSKSGGGTTGYDYYMSLFMGVCRGPVDHLLEIKVADLVAWKGDVTGNGVFQINAADLFGGQQKEGGIAGPVTVLMGAPTQLLPDNVRASLAGNGYIPGLIPPDDTGAPTGGGTGGVSDAPPPVGAPASPSDA